MEFFGVRNHLKSENIELFLTVRINDIIFIASQ